jgi:hypothetical protein
MLVNSKQFDGSTSYTEGRRRLTSYAGNAVWVPIFTPRPFPQRNALRRLLAIFHRKNMCSFLSGSFAMAVAGILNSFDNVIVFVALTDIRLVNVIFQTEDHLSMRRIQ